MAKSKIGAERWRLDHISFKAWCALARKRGWNGEDDADGLREYCEPDEAATITFHASLDAAKAAALAIFAAAPDDSAFGAILIDYQVLEEAHDGPEWETQRAYEITSDGDMLECRI